VHALRGAVDLPRHGAQEIPDAGRLFRVVIKHGSPAPRTQEVIGEHFGRFALVAGQLGPKRFGHPRRGNGGKPDRHAPHVEEEHRATPTIFGNR